MRKVYLFLFICFMASCSSIQNDAEKQLRNTIQELARNPETFKILELETVYKSPSDSLIVMSFTGRGQNGFGGYNVTRYEYYYFISKDGSRYEQLVNLEEEKSESFNYWTKRYFENCPDSLYDKTIRGVAGIRTIFHGREIETK
ncbi:MAG: hypothetical protein IKA83_06405 [Paludibacteraceae bacterium]|nr:hypothetical protein [Paludibacteraceae bacterium]